MRHRKFSQRLSRPMGHRQATLRNLVINILKHQRIRTTKAKAKIAQPLLEHLISIGKKNNLQSRRKAYRIINDRAAVSKLFSQIAPLFKNKTSGFSRIIHYSRRQGDGAELVLFELTEKIPKIKTSKPEKEKLLKKKMPPRKAEKATPEIKAEGKPSLPQEKAKPPKKLKPKRFLGGLRRLFKKERDSL